MDNYEATLRDFYIFYMDGKPEQKNSDQSLHKQFKTMIIETVKVTIMVEAGLKMKPSRLFSTVNMRFTCYNFTDVEV